MSSIPDGDGTPTEPLRRQADLVMAGAEAADLIPADLQEVRRAYDRRFGTPSA